MSSYGNMAPFFILFFLLPIISTQTLQKEKCCTRKTGGLRSRTFSSIDGCFCKEIPNGFSICYDANNQPNSCTIYPKQMVINTTQLIVRSTSIKVVHQGDFDKLAHLETLTLEDNTKLNSLEEFVFKGMKNLRTLNIDFSPLLNNFHPNVFQGLFNLKALKVTNCGFLKIQDLTMALKINILPNLQKLNITGNSFLSIEHNDFKSMENKTSNAVLQLEELDLSSCGIKYIEKEALNPLKKLSHLHLGNNSLYEENMLAFLETAFSSRIPLTYLDLHAFGFNGTIPSKISKILSSSHIDSLNLKENKFGFLEKDTIKDTLPDLKTLDLSNSEITFLDSSFFSRTPNLEKLILNKHNLSYFTLPKALPNLKYLDLSEFTKKGYWEFFHLQTEVENSKVEYLDLHSTRMAFLQRDSFKFMSALKELDLSKCIITRISTGAFLQLNKLRYLNLEDNQFFILYVKYPTEPFIGLNNLDTLLVGGNSISYLSSGEKRLFKHLTNLRCLGLQRNSLEFLTADDFVDLPNLETLDISSNPLYAWEGQVFFNSKIKNFYASSNQFNYLSQAMLEDFSSFTTLDIDYNPFSCDCRMMRRMYPHKLLLKEIKESPRYNSLLCAGSHEIKVIDYLEAMNFSDCEPKKSSMIYFFGFFLAIAFLAGFLILVYIVKDQLPYLSSFLRSTESRQNIL